MITETKSHRWGSKNISSNLSDDSTVMQLPRDVSDDPTVIQMPRDLGSYMICSTSNSNLNTKLID